MKVLLHLIFWSTIFIGCTHSEWGHHFDFTNNTGYEIDSLSITVGEASTIVLNTEYGMSENLSVPKEGYPHEVKIKIYSNGTTVDLIADSFNCHNCDGSHEYILTPDSARYKFLN